MFDEDNIDYFMEIDRAEIVKRREHAEKLDSDPMYRSQYIKEQESNRRDREFRQLLQDITEEKNEEIPNNDDLINLINTTEDIIPNTTGMSITINAQIVNVYNCHCKKCD